MSVPVIPSRMRFKPLAIWLVLMALALGIVVHSRFSTDLSVFLPTQPSARQQILVDQIKEGALSRLILIGIDGGTATQRAQASQQLAQWLRNSPDFDGAINADADSREKDFAWLLQHRYLLSNQITTEHLQPEGLQASIQAGAAALATPQGLLLKSLFTRDPTGEVTHLMSQLSSDIQPNTQTGVLASTDGQRALLMTLTRIGGEDTDGQERLLRLIREEFSRLNQGKPASQQLLLQLTGAPVFAVQARASIKQEIERLSLTGIIGITLLFLWVYRSLLTLAIGLIPVLSAMLIATAAVGLGFPVVHAMTIGFGTTLLGESIDYSIYYLVQGQGNANWRQHFWPAIRLGVATSVCGFAALLLSSFPGLAQLGAYSLCGLIAAALTTRYVLPALPVRPINKKRLLILGRFMERARQRLTHLRWPLLLLVTAATALLIWSPLPLWSSQLSDLNPAPRHLQALDQQMREQVGAPQLDHLIAIRAASQEQGLQAAEAVLSALSPLVAQGQIMHIDSPSRLLPSEVTQRARQNALLPTVELQQRLEKISAQLPVNIHALARFTSDMEQARQQPLLTQSDLTGTSFAFAFQAMTQQRDGHWLLLLPLRAPAAGLAPTTIASITTLLKSLFPSSLSASAPGLPTTSAEYMNLNAETNQMFGSYLVEAWKLASAGAVAILLLLAVNLRSLRRLVRVAAPLAGAVALVMAAQVLLGKPMTLLHLVGLLLVVAVGSNYALFFESLLSTASTQQGDQSQQLALASLLLANLTTVMGFGILALSQFPALHALGSTVGPGAVLALLLSMIWIKKPQPKPAT